MKFGRSFWIGWAIFTVAAALITLLEVRNSLQILSDLKVRAPAWQGWTNGWSSIIALVAIFPGVRLLAALTRPGRAPIWKIVALQTPAALGFWLLHFAGFSFIRVVVYGAHGQAYPIDVGALLHEAPQDLPTYALIVVAIWWALALEDRAEASAAARAASPPTFDIRDNAHVIRVATQDILAVSSADNYVEFHLRDGRRPLMRATLAAIEARLMPHGFTRTHRSWLANTAHIVELKPTGAGDFTVVLQNGLEIPLSRRFRAEFNAQGMPARMA